MATPMDATIKQRLAELLPWYVNGRISAEDRDWVQARLAEDESARAALQWHQSLADDIRNEVNALPADAGLRTLLKRIRAERSPTAPASWLARFLDNWSAMARGPALAAAAVLLVAQGGTIGFLLSRDDGNAELGQVRSLDSQDAVWGPVFQITFTQTTGERELRQLMLDVGGRFVDGPDQFGAYIVAVAPERREVARRALEKDPHVAALTVIERFVPHR